MALLAAVLFIAGCGGGGDSSGVVGGDTGSPPNNLTCPSYPIHSGDDPVIVGLDLCAESTLINHNDELQLVSTSHYENGDIGSANHLGVWASSNPAIVSIDRMGRIKGISPGQVTITHTVAGFSRTVGISVRAVVTKIALFSASTSVIKYEDFVLHAIAELSNAPINDPTGDYVGLDQISKMDNGLDYYLTSCYPRYTQAFCEYIKNVGQEASWSSSSESVATMRQDGWVDAHSAGTVDITVVIDDVSISQRLRVEVPMSLHIRAEQDWINIANTLSLDAYALYTDGVQRNLVNLGEWSSDRPSVISVDALGRARAFQSGSALIRFTLGEIEDSKELRSVDPYLVPVVYTNRDIALKQNGSVISWSSHSAWSSVADQLDGSKPVVSIKANRFGAAALYEDGSVLSWGGYKVNNNSPTVQTELDGRIKAVSLHSTTSAFAALREDGSVVTWGTPESGGDSSSVSAKLNGDIDVVSITGISHAFAALRKDGSIVTWGWSDSNSLASSPNGQVQAISIIGNNTSFASLHEDGSVSTWGDHSAVGNIALDPHLVDGAVNVVSITGNNSAFSAFAALREDGSVVTWGNSTYGGDSSDVTTEINGSIKVTAIYANNHAFAATREDGSVVTWGYDSFGGDSSSVGAELDGTIDVISITGNSRAFAARRKDGSVVTWGYGADGGDISVNISPPLDGGVDVVSIASTSSAFAALREDGSVAAWGDPDDGGETTAVASKLDGTVRVRSISEGVHGFVALRENGSLITWGRNGVFRAGGDSGMYPYSQEYDTDRDGIDNLSELTFCSQLGICLSAGNPDTDGDGVWDGFELQNATNPFAANSRAATSDALTTNDGTQDANGDGYPDSFIMPDNQINTPN